MGLRATLGQLVIELAANTARLQSDMGKAVGIAEKASAKIKGAFKFAGGGLIGAALASTVKQSIEFGDQINKAAIKAGIGTKAMSELAYAAKLADVDIGSLSTALKKMQVSLSEAGTGAKGPIGAFAALGLTFDQLQKRKPAAQFELIADRISKLSDPADRARAAVEIFGKAGADLLPLFEQGAAGIAKARAEAEKLGLSFGDDQIKALSEADDSIKRLSASWQGFATTLTAAVAPALSTVFDRLSGLDTRNIATQIADLERASAPRRGLLAADRDSMATRLGNLRGLQDLQTLRNAQTGTSGGPSSRGAGIAIGYGPADAALRAQEAAEKLAKEQQKYVDQFSAGIESIDQMFAESADDQLTAATDSWTDQMVAWQQFEDERAKAEEETNKQIEQWRADQASKLSEGAQMFRDVILNAWDDMVNTGKIRWDELLKYMLAQWGRMQIASLFDKKNSSGGGGWVDSLAGAIAGAFTGGGGDSTSAWIDDFRAAGGPVSAGRTYMVGEKGRELFTPGTSGYITPNNKLGGNINLSPVYNINNPDNTAALPRILRENNRQLLDDLDRRGLLKAS